MPGTDWDLLSSYAGILSLATLSVYSGAYGSLKAPPKPKSQRKPGEDEDEDDEDIPDRLSKEDAYLFPIIGSVVLGGMYLVVKYFGTNWINLLLTWYFAIFGVGSVWNSSIAIARLLVGVEKWKTFERVKFLILRGPWEVFELSCRTPSLFLFPPSLIPSAVFLLFPNMKSAIVTNILGLSFAHGVLSFGKLDTFATGCILLAGLFIYDIWWVFGTEVMVKVATSLDVPIKILWAKSLSFDTKRGYTMLGLGDIVIPGMFVALALRYDFSRSGRKSTRESFPKPFFTAALYAYVLGLLTTMVVMHRFKAAQPALLYLSPACILSFVFTGLVGGDLKAAWAWKDEVQKTPDEEKTAPVTPAVATGQKSVLESSAPDATRATNGDSASPLTVEDAEGDGQSGDETAENEEDGSKKKKRKSKKKRS